MAYRVIPLEPRHVPQAVDVHMRAFRTFFLTFLGPRFLREFYGSFVTDPAGIGFAAEEDGTGRVLGSVVGPQTPAGYFKRLLKRRWWAFCIASLSAVLRRPTVIKRLFRAVFYRGEAPAGAERALLSSISVSPDAQGQGVGKALMLAWAEEARRRGAVGAFLTTDAADNDAVNRFYQSLGWRLESSFATPEGRRMNRYVLDFAPAAEVRP